MFRIIIGQAQSNSKVQDLLYSKVDPIVDHIMKIYLMPNHESRNHWVHEIYTFINRVDYLKSTKKYPTAKQIYKWTYDVVQDRFTNTRTFEKLVKGMCRKYNVTLDRSPVEFMYDFDNICESYFRWLSEELSDIGVVNEEDVSEELDKLIKR